MTPSGLTRHTAVQCIVKKYCKRCDSSEFAVENFVQDDTWKRVVKRTLTFFFLPYLELLELITVYLCWQPRNTVEESITIYSIVYNTVLYLTPMAASAQSRIFIYYGGPVRDSVKCIM